MFAGAGQFEIFPVPSPRMGFNVEQQLLVFHDDRKLKDPNRKDLKSIAHGNELFYLPPTGSKERNEWIEVSSIS